MKPEEDLPYLRPLVDECSKEDDLRAAFRLETPLMAGRVKPQAWKGTAVPDAAAVQKQQVRLLTSVRV